MPVDYRALFERLTKRYGGATPEALESILCPILIPIRSLDKEVIRIEGQKHYRASFTIATDKELENLVVPGTTGKFVPKSYKDGGVWNELAKGRILRVDPENQVAEGEVYTGVGGKKNVVEAGIMNLSVDDFWEVDQY